MHGKKWRVGVMAGLLALTVSGCDIGDIIAGVETSKTPDPVPADVIKQRGDLLGVVYAADIAANQARDTAVIHCGNLPFKDLTSPKCKEEQRTELYEKSDACATAIRNYNKIRGTENEIVRFESKNPRRNNQLITCAYDKN